MPGSDLSVLGADRLACHVLETVRKGLSLGRRPVRSGDACRPACADAEDAISAETGRSGAVVDIWSVSEGGCVLARSSKVVSQDADPHAPVGIPAPAGVDLAMEPGPHPLPHPRSKRGVEGIVDPDFTGILFLPSIAQVAGHFHSHAVEPAVKLLGIQL